MDFLFKAWQIIFLSPLPCLWLEFSLRFILDFGFNVIIRLGYTYVMGCKSVWHCILYSICLYAVWGNCYIFIGMNENDILLIIGCYVFLSRAVVYESIINAIAV